MHQPRGMRFGASVTQRDAFKPPPPRLAERLRGAVVDDTAYLDQALNWAA